eukprot:TRINITY_DN29697_c0_g1_i2.p1 TRINITY_DN29697_c0_g1~~TRINITY_DN29697_c0_g1_i2.p1  ORF type:complete len:354 (-),score=52.14 TRINITY_DN29697_c0_g1_i2:257-1318(-)
MSRTFKYFPLRVKSKVAVDEAVGDPGHTVEADSDKSSEAPDSEDDSTTHRESQLSRSVWDSALIDFIFIVDRHKSHKGQICLMAATSLILYVTNIILQLSCAFLFLFYDESPVLKTLQRLPGGPVALRTVTDRLNAAADHNATLAGTADYQMDADVAYVVLDLCKKEGVTRFVWFYFIMMVVWFARVVGDISQSVARTLHIMSVSDRVHPGLEMVARGKVRRLSWHLKIMLILLVQVPKLIVAVALSCAGSFILLVQRDTIHVLTRALVLQLVMTFDDLLIDTLGTTRMLRRLSDLRIRHRKVSPAWWLDWGGGVFTCGFVFGMAFMTFWTGAQGMTFFRLACLRHLPEEEDA